MKFYWQHWVSSTDREVLEVGSRYESLVSAKGELFEDVKVPLTAEDTKDAEARRKKFSRIWMIFFSIILAFAAISIILGREHLKVNDYAYMGLLVALILGYRYFIKKTFDRALNLKEKRVVKGVITRKKMVRKKGCFLEFSQKLTIQVMPENYKKITIGDIIQMEMLGEELFVRRKFVTLGKI